MERPKWLNLNWFKKSGQEVAEQKAPEEEVPAPNTVKSKSATLSQQATWTYRMLHEQVAFLKRQQWSITNYVAVIYGAIFASTKALAPIDIFEKRALIIGAVIAGVYGIVLVLAVQCDLAKARIRLDNADRRLFGSTEYSQLGMFVEKYPFLRGHLFTVAMYFVLIGAGAFLVYYLLKLPVHDAVEFVPELLRAHQI
jgi:hypothetical protein